MEKNKKLIDLDKRILEAKIYVLVFLFILVILFNLEYILSYLIVDYVIGSEVPPPPLIKELNPLSSYLNPLFDDMSIMSLEKPEIQDLKYKWIMYDLERKRLPFHGIYLQEMYVTRMTDVTTMTDFKEITSNKNHWRIILNYKYIRNPKPIIFEDIDFESEWRIDKYPFI